MSTLSLRGARQNNLAGLDLDLPHGRLIAFCGVSGSGKSSLAFEILHQEGRRRFAETLHARARGLLDPGARPRFDSLTGLPPTLAVSQRAEAPPGPRATVGTLTDLHELLTVRVLREGRQGCPTCGGEVRSQSRDEVLAALMAAPEGSPLTLLAPKVEDEAGGHRVLIEGLMAEGWLRARVDGALVRLDELGPLDARVPHRVDVVVDRVRVAPDREARVAEAVRVALRLGDGRMFSLGPEGERAWATRPWCGTCRVALPAPEPALLSFNSPKGACPACEGLGRVGDAEALVLDPARSVRDGAVVGLFSGDPLLDGALERIADALELDLDAPWAALPEAHRRLLLEGRAEPVSTGTEGPALRFGGAAARARLDPRVAGRPCAACGGTRLRPEARAFTLHGRALPEWSAMPLGELATQLAAHPRDPLLAPVHEELARRLDMLARCGLAHLTLDRDAAALSPGERRRLRLATLAGSALSGALYVLDEPTAGLHPRETAALVDLLRRLRDEGNTVLVVSHDEGVLRAVDLCVELGPGAGPEGGRLVFVGPPEALARADTPTGRHLAGRAEAPSPRPVAANPRLRLRGARGHNLRGVDLDLPLGALVVVTGPGGSGRSSLVFDTLERALAGRALPRPLPFDALEGAEPIERVRVVEPRPIGANARSLVASFLGVLGPLRELLAQTTEAKVQGWGPGHFSPGRPGGRCEACAGTGVQALELAYLPDLHVPCPVCGGDRFDRATLRVRWRGLNLAELLALDAAGARRHLSGQPRLERLLRALEDVGLGYLPLGQPTATLSGGEAQRLRLARDLASGATLARTLYLLDEPATGLHPCDVARLGACLRRLVDEGATVLAIENDPAFVRLADHELAMGPGGGAEGGHLTYAGPPRASP